MAHPLHTIQEIADRMYLLAMNITNESSEKQMMTLHCAAIYELAVEARGRPFSPSLSRIETDHAPFLRGVADVLASPSTSPRRK